MDGYVGIVKGLTMDVNVKPVERVDNFLEDIFGVQFIAPLARPRPPLPGYRHPDLQLRMRSKSN